ncbi:hydantoinase/oxoprolinase family protein [Ammoniphilus sp. CFH 90114]|uniref:hydantoinase/oxoprolinase family protein n=1 Tax=Ammoniphilus sp. CFH 90114 TaxID=2493665 RepID=UPI00100D9CCB|nr:hydantoinase/oxoprolinase family protein [Ammoniphilus sp. CFH 90114]RXT06368.1 hypothetical protein EIZ39_14940 [Ammoniphilus sp. CFH 90114]
MMILGIDLGSTFDKYVFINTEDRAVRLHRHPSSSSHAYGVGRLKTLCEHYGFVPSDIREVIYGATMIDSLEDLSRLFPHAKMTDPEQMSDNFTHDQRNLILFSMGASTISIEGTSALTELSQIGGGSIITSPENEWFAFDSSFISYYPGPASFGQGGTQATVLDAHVLLGRLFPFHFLGDNLALSKNEAYGAINRLSSHREQDPFGTANHIISQINHSVSASLLNILNQHNLVAEETNLVACGGMGPLHAVEIAQNLGIPEVLVPRFPSLGFHMNETISRWLKENEPRLHERNAASDALLERSECLFCIEDRLTNMEVSFYDREKLFTGTALYGPAIVVQADSTTWIPPYCHAVVDEDQFIRIQVSYCY